MRKLVLLTLLLAAIPTLAVAQDAEPTWAFDQIFPDPDAKANRQNHGLAVDPDGKVWLQNYYAQTGDSVFVAELGVKRAVTALYCYNPDGSACAFSPLNIIPMAGGGQDTLGGTLIRDANGNPAWDYRTGRGLRTDHEGNILVVYFNTLYRINYKTGEGMDVVQLGQFGLDDRGATAPAVDEFGNVYITGVFNGDPMVRLNPDFSFGENVIAVTNGISRSFEVAPDGNAIYFAGYNNKRVDRYARLDQFEAFPETPEAVLTGYAAESFAWDPKTGWLWISAGSPNDKPEEPYKMHTWYAFDVNDFSAPKDQFAWHFASEDDPARQGRPRAIAFSPTGDTVYVGQFSQGLSAVQRFLRAEGVSVEPVGMPAAGFELKGNYPNPVVGVTTIEFALPVSAHTTVKVYDTLGREVVTLVDQTLAPDTYRVNFDSENLPAGIYLYRVNAGGSSLTGTMTVVR